MTNTATKTYRVGVIERAIAYYEVEAADARSAAENWEEGEFHDRDDEALESEGPCNVRVEQPDGTWRKVPRSEWEEVPDIVRFDDYEIEPRIRHWEDGDPEKPDHIACDEHEADMWRLYGNRPAGIPCASANTQRARWPRTCMPASPAGATLAKPESPTNQERSLTMKKQRNITFKVWLEIEQYNEKTGDSQNLDAPGSYLAEFQTYKEAWDYAERVTRLAEGINR